MPKLLKNPWFIIVIMVLALLAIIIFIVIPAVGDIRNLNQKIIGQRTLLESRYEKRLNIKNSIRNHNTIQPQIPALMNLTYLNPGNEIDFITALETLADKNGVRQTIIFDTQNGEMILQDKKKVPIEIILNGNYLNILKYMRDLEKLNFYLIITKVSTAPHTTDLSGNVRTLFRGYTYWKNNSD